MFESLPPSEKAPGYSLRIYPAGSGRWEYELIRNGQHTGGGYAHSRLDALERVRRAGYDHLLADETGYAIEELGIGDAFHLEGLGSSRTMTKTATGVVEGAPASSADGNAPSTFESESIDPSLIGKAQGVGDIVELVDRVGNHYLRPSWDDTWPAASKELRERSAIVRAKQDAAKAEKPPAETEIAAALRRTLRLQAGADAAMLQVLVDERYDEPPEGKDGQRKLQREIAEVIARLEAVDRVTPIFELLNEGGAE